MSIWSTTEMRKCIKCARPAYYEVAMLDGAIKEFAVAYGRTSNLFSTGYDILVHKDDAILVLPAINILALQHRNPERFTLTALTGKSEFDEKDKLLLEAWKRVQAGEDPAKVEEDIRRRVVEGGEVH